MIPGADPRHSATADRADAIRRAVAAPPRDRYRAPIAQAMRAQALRIAEAGPPAPDLTGPAIRLVCVLAAGAFALHRWLGLIDAPPRGALFRTVLVTGALGAVLLRARRIRSRARRFGAIAGALAGALALLLLVAGTPFADLAPRAWGRLADGSSTRCIRGGSVRSSRSRSSPSCTPSACAPARRRWLPPRCS